MKLFTFLIAFLFFSSGCDVRTREQQLQTRETAINQKEQELLLKEKTLQLKEEELFNRERRLDSSSIKDTTFIYDTTLVGVWSVKMICIETSCAGSAVGDTKTEQWNIYFQGSNILAKAMVGDKLVRVYRGVYRDDALELVDDSHTLPSEPLTKMIVRLRVINKKTMEGQREIVREKDCKIIYSMQLNKQ